MKRLFIGILFLSVLCPVLVEAQTPRVCQASNPCHIQWDANTEPDMSSYRFYLSSVSGVYPSVPVLTVTHPTTTGTLGVLPQGTYYVRVTAVDQSGNESLPSNELTFFYDGVPGSPIIRFSVSIP